MVAAITKVFSLEKKKDLAIEFWTLVGPFFIVLTLFLTSFSTIANKDLFLLGVVGLFLCLKKRKKGLYYSLLFLMIISFFKHYQLQSHHIWQLGIELSLGMGLIISYHCFEYISSVIAKVDISHDKYEKDVFDLKETINKEKDFHRRQQKNFQYEIEQMNMQLEEKSEEIVAYKDLVQNFRKTIKENEEDKAKLLTLYKDKEKYISGILQEMEDMKQNILDLEDHNVLHRQSIRLKEEIEKEKQEKNQIETINQTLRKKLSEEIELKKSEKEKYLQQIEKFNNIIASLKEENNDLKNKFTKKINEKNESSFTEEEKNLLKQYEKKILELKQYKSLYDQLKKQFEDKKDVLSDTRKKLFTIEEQLLAIEKEKKMEELELPSEIRKMNKQIEIFEKAIADLENENKELNDIVSSLMNGNNS